MNTNEMLLDVKNLNVSYNSLHVLFGASIQIARGEVVVVVGRRRTGAPTRG